MLIPAGETKPVRLLVETSGDAGGGGGVPDPGWGSARARSGSMSGLPRPTAGETGTLEATVVDKEGNVVKGADVSVYDGGERVEGMLTTAEGKVSIGAPDGHLHRQSHQTRLPAVGEGGTSRSGSAGRPTSGIVPLDKENFFAEIRVKSPSRVAPRSAQTRQYEMTLRNAGRNDDTYALSVEGLPEQWYARFRESREATEEVSEIYVPAGRGEDPLPRLHPALLGRCRGVQLHGADRLSGPAVRGRPDPPAPGVIHHADPTRRVTATRSTAVTPSRLT